MAHGHWGSRFPIGNVIGSKAVFAFVDYRLSCLRFKNRVKRILSPPKVAIENPPSARLFLMKWLDQGYDKLNIGGGPKDLKGFVNIDFMSHPNVPRQVMGNIRDLSFIPDECASQVHSNHVLEHLPPTDLVNQIREWHRILKREGLLTLRGPNALGAAYGFWFEPVIETQKDEFIKLGFPADEDFGNPADRWVHKDFYGLIHWFYGDAGNIVNQHLSLLTPSMLSKLLDTEGFQVLKMTEPEAMNIAVVARKAVSGRSNTVYEFKE